MKSNYVAAFQNYYKALKITQNLYGERHVKSLQVSRMLAKSLNNVGADFERKKQYAEAIQYYEKAVKVMREITNEKDADFQKCVRNLEKLKRKTKE